MARSNHSTQHARPLHVVAACLAIIVSLGLFPSSARADIVTQWNFNSPVNDANVATGTLTPNIGLGTPLAVGGTTSPGFATTQSTNPDIGSSSDPNTTDDSGWTVTSFPAQGTASGTAGAQFNVSTLGYQNIIISWDHRHQAHSSGYVQFEYSLDGSNFASAGLVNGGVLANLYATNGSGFWFNNLTVDLTSIAGAANNPDFAFRVVSIFDPALGNAYTASSLNNPGYSNAAIESWRFDMVTINGTVIPAPGALALLAVASLMGSRRRRRIHVREVFEESVCIARDGS